MDQRGKYLSCLGYHRKAYVIDWWRWLTRKIPLLEIASPLLKRAAVCAICLVLSRIGNVIFLPGLDLEAVGSNLTSGAEHAALQGDLQGHLFGLASPLSIYSLGIGPYIDASWLLSGMMLLKFPLRAYRHLNTLRRSGREGASALKLYTQVGALGFAVVLGARRAAELRPYAGRRALFVTDTMLQLVAGAMVLRYAVDQNERAGLGDGIALLICAGIGSRYADLLQRLPAALAAAQAPVWNVGLAVAGCGALVYAATFITKVEKRLPLVYYKRRLKERQKEITHGILPPEPQRAPDYIPLRLTPSGTGSLLMASFVFSLLPACMGWLSPAAASALAALMFSPAVKPWAFGVVVMLTCYLDFSGGSAAHDFSEWLGSVDAGVKGISPGPFTEEFLTREQGTLRLLGSLCMAGLAIAAHLLDATCTRQLGFSLDSLSLILMSGFITTAHRQAQALLRIPRLSRALAQERELLKLSSIGA
ncbi:hypothetical protein CVIRNUC_001213 [Coccomyxa viridis]|uniref:Uncharacterized protein n=1 Tax=Coccomyxa viridis TaxID=1274662 RepID=A0AAV1HTF4_9CHLO|nr:hypothetical protein CVIRNUC_001213 [Coccomyxa viridis]